MSGDECRHCGRLLDEFGQCWACDTETRTPWACDRREAITPDLTLELSPGCETSISLVVSGCLVSVDNGNGRERIEDVDGTVGTALDVYEARRLARALLDAADAMEREGAALLAALNAEGGPQ